MGFIENVCAIVGCSRDSVSKEILIIVTSIVLTVVISILLIFISVRIPRLKPILAIVPLLFTIPTLSISRCKCILEYLKFTSSLGREELYACVAILVLSLLGSWNYVSRVLQHGFPATARVLRSKSNIGSKLFKEVKDIVENIVFKDGTLPHVARERIMHTLRMSIEDYGTLTQILITGLAMLYMFFIVISFLSFMSPMFNPSMFVFIVTFLTFIFSALIMSKSPIHDYAITELKEKIKLILPTSIIVFIISLIVIHDFSISAHILLISFFILGLALLKCSRKIDKIDNAVVWDRVLNLRLIKGVPVDQALQTILGRDVYEIYTRTYPFNAIKNLLTHLEDIGGLGIVRMFREMIVEIFNAMNKVMKNVKVNVLMLVGFALAMIGMQIWFVTLLLPALKMMKMFGFSLTSVPAYTNLPIQMSPEAIVQSLNTTITYVPPIVTLAVFMIMRGCSSSTRAMKIALVTAIVLLCTQVIVKYFIVPHL